MFGLRISNELMAEIAKWAEKNETNRSEAIRRVVERAEKGKTECQPES
jgi:metal-responsive CopG/Arc/MetJ family transcriptional regulator